MRFQKMSVVTVVCALVVAVPGLAAAQACIGVPINDGAFAVEGQFSTTEGAKGFGGVVTGNLLGPLSLQGGYTLVDFDDVDDNANSFQVKAAYEVPNLKFSACPVAGFQYSKWSTETLGFGIDISQTLIPVGIGIGRTFETSSNLNVTLFAVPQFLYLRGKVSASNGTNGGSESDSSTEFGADLGVRLGSGSLFGGAGAFFTSIEDSDPVFTLSIGFAFGR